ncbi:hypothetical protein F3J14_01325 [Burkholderia sp. Tr-862]|uniref:hypothetical protein n=1 Tax=Burkholderia sp. Tr-862 TaxID=2608331 RepID=UPI001419D128|nr:hypothetical protein [Burkholderia sp. Tr-862]NIF39567.1 hypothetical protein [Burkholderia sp. Tr-862]
MARKKSKAKPSILTNEGLIFAILDDLGLEFNHHEKIAGAKEAGISMFSIPFTLEGEPDDELSFLAYIFCHEHAAILRLYAVLYTVPNNIDASRVTRIINSINADHMLDGFLDFPEKHRTIRIRTNFRSEAGSLPVKPTQEYLSEFFDVCANTRLILKTALESDKSFPDDVAEGKSALVKKIDWKPSPLL